MSWGGPFEISQQPYLTLIHNNFLDVKHLLCWGSPLAQSTTTLNSS